jgi:quercetin dioxygenase-like cupin family protein
MKIVIIGGTGLIGAKLAARLEAKGHGVVAGSPRTGVNALTGEGLAQALAGAETVVDVSNAPSFEEGAVLDSFERSGRNLLAAEAAAGVRHHVVLSIVGTDRLPGNGYLRAKLVQERLIKASAVPYTIVRATQLFEFLASIAEAGAIDGRIVVPSALLQPIAADDVARGEARITTVFDQPLPNVPGKSLKGVVEYGPGGSSPAHTHAPSAFIYATVLEGAVRSKINDGPERVFGKGESFAESPGDHHGVSANASDSEPSKLLAVFVVDTDTTALTVPDPK